MLLNKPKFWDYKKSNLLSILLIPFSMIIGISNLINFLYHKKKLKIKTICVGNIYVGGTGKTPVSIEIYKILKKSKIKSVFIKKKRFSHRDEIKLLSKIGQVISLKSRIKSIEDAYSDNARNPISSKADLAYEMSVSGLDAISKLANRIDTLERHAKVHIHGFSDTLGLTRELNRIARGAGVPTLFKDE